MTVSKKDSKHETKLNFEVIGWGTGYWLSHALALHIRVTGTGPNGNLKGKVLYTPTDKNEWERVRFVGDGRYSFMHGNSSLRTQDGKTEVPGLNRGVIKKIGDKWILDHPNGVLDYKILQAREHVTKVQAQLDQARVDVERFTANLAQAFSALHELQSQQATQMASEPQGAL